MYFSNNALIKKLTAFSALSERELAVLSGLHLRRRSFEAGRVIIHQGQTPRFAHVVVSGWANAHKTLPDGSRQIIDFKIAGDFMGLHSVLMQRSDQTVEAITDTEVSEVAVDEVLETFAQMPRLTKAVVWAASRDHALVAEHLVDVGRRGARERMAHFLLELGARLVLVGQADETGYECPLTQYLLADALGLSAVHVNRILRGLREDGLLTFRNGHVAFDDYSALIALAGFDKDYLEQTDPWVA